MSKIVHIHGYAFGLEALPFKKFCDETDYFWKQRHCSQHQVEVFRWEEKLTLKHIHKLNPLAYLKLYLKERNKTDDPAWQSQLVEFMNKNQPEVVVCHSMGSRIFMNTFNQNQLPESIKLVVFTQPDIDHNQTITNPEIVNRIESKKLKFIATHCFWDQALWSSVIVNTSFRMGIFGSRNKLFENKFFPLIKMPNPHEGILKDPKFLTLFKLE